MKISSRYLERVYLLWNIMMMKLKGYVYLSFRQSERMECIKKNKNTNIEITSIVMWKIFEVIQISKILYAFASCGRNIYYLIWYITTVNWLLCYILPEEINLFWFNCLRKRVLNKLFVWYEIKINKEKKTDIVINRK